MMQIIYHLLRKITAAFKV